jgi:Na+/H+ antiporter NhaD/arsenite permease-like protein
MAVAPVLADACLRRGLDPVPFLLALACAANIGSAATLIGNPQNMLIGEVLKLPFGGYFLEAVVPGPLFAAALVLSNVVSNVPAVMLLLPAATEPFSGPMLALVSTLAGNLLIVGSIANIIVVDAARRQGIAIDWRRHLRTGVPVTIATLAITALWFGWRAGAMSF